MGTMTRRRRQILQGPYALNASAPAWIEPMRAIEGAAPPAGESWLWEPRLAGIRCLAFITKGRVRLRSGHGIPLEPVMPEIALLLPALVRGNAVLDGVYGSGVLQLFDCLHYEGVSLRPLPLLDRQAVLRDAVWFDDLVRLAPSDTTLDAAVSRTPVSDGFIVKRADSPYRSGPSGDWRALVNTHLREFVVGGYVQAAGRRTPSALLVGRRCGMHLMYAGRVSAAGEPDALATVTSLLRRLRRRTCPFESAAPHGPDIHWASPSLVAQVGFREWTDGGLVRDGRVIGVRA
jgi:bifunctional non-homologous end joining protein LigD